GGPLARPGDPVAFEKKRHAAASVRGRYVGAGGDLVAGVVDEAGLLYAGRKLCLVETEHLLEDQRVGTNLEYGEPGARRCDDVVTHPRSRIRDPAKRGRRGRHIEPRLLAAGRDIDDAHA